LWVGGGEGRGGEGASFLQVVVQSGLSTIHFPLRQWTIDFLCKHFLFIYLFRRGEVGQRKEFEIAPQFYPIICFGQMLSSFHLSRWAKGKEIYNSK
jgi:hypothetical protein